MKLGIQLLDTSSTINSIRKITEQTIRQGETADVYFQLLDLDQAGFRYIPSNVATAFIEIPRFTQALPTTMNIRTDADYSVRKYAALLSADDRSLWKFSLSNTETQNMMSSGMRVTVTDGTNIKIGYLTLAFRVYRSENPTSWTPPS